MAFQPFTPEAIIIDVCDKVFQGTILKQRAEFLGMFIEIEPTDRTASIMMKTQVRYFAYDEGAYGAEIQDPHIALPRTVPLMANNNYAVYFDLSNPGHPLNGQVLFFRCGDSPTGWQALQSDGSLVNVAGDLNDPEFEPRPLLLQGDSFSALMKLPVVFQGLIINNMLAANGPMFNRFR